MSHSQLITDLQNCSLGPKALGWWITESSERVLSRLFSTSSPLRSQSNVPAACFFSSPCSSLKIKLLGTPWWSSGWDSVLPLQGARVQSLVGELGSHMPRGTAEKKKDPAADAMGCLIAQPGIPALGPIVRLFEVNGGNRL